MKTGWLDGLTEAFFLLYYKSIYHSLSLLSSFKPSLHPIPALLSPSMAICDGYVIETSCKAYNRFSGNDSQPILIKVWNVAMKYVVR